MNPSTHLALAIVLASASASSHMQASIAYGSINNFDTVNDTGVEAHGFEIELDDCHSADISYTYDWNHYGVPNIAEDNTLLGHPKTVIRWESKKNPDGSWAAYTAIPAGPIAPTDGHQFTDPTQNFGGEHFGAGFMVQPSAVRYHWLIDNGGVLVAGPAVQVATPSFTYIPAVPPAPGIVAVPAQVQAEIVPPEPAEPPPVGTEFGDAVWVKEIRTTSHNGNEVELRNLVSDDPDNPNDKNWRNGEPDEVETEWQLLQTDYNKAGGGPNGLLQGLPEELSQGDEVITRRYEFFKYTGPLDAETGEAMAQNVAADGRHGVGIKTINGEEVDLSTVVVVGDFVGSQMAAFDVAATVGLIDHLQDGVVGDSYPDRRVVIAGQAPFTATLAGNLPEGMTFDTVTGVLAGVPTVSGTFNIAVAATDGIGPDANKNYTLKIANPGDVVSPQYLIDTSVSLAGGGFTHGDGGYDVDTVTTVTAVPKVGYAFVEWTENGNHVSSSARYTFALNINHSLVANFIPAPVMTISAPLPGMFRISWPANPPGWSLQESPDLSTWTRSNRAISEQGGENRLNIINPAGNQFFRLYHP